MFDNRVRTLRIAFVITCVWGAVAGIAWFMIDPTVTLVGARATSIGLADASLLERADLSQDKAVLEKTLAWGMQRDGLPVTVKVTEVAVNKKIVWNVAATVVRPKDRYLLILDQGTKLITQISEGEKLPDGSKLLKIALNSYSVQTVDGKRRTVETSF